MIDLCLKFKSNVVFIDIIISFFQVIIDIADTSILFAKLRKVVKTNMSYSPMLKVLLLFLIIYKVSITHFISVFPSMKFSIIVSISYSVSVRKPYSLYVGVLYIKISRKSGAVSINKIEV